MTSVPIRKRSIAPAKTTACTSAGSQAALSNWMGSSFSAWAELASALINSRRLTPYAASLRTAHHDHVNIRIGSTPLGLPRGRFPFGSTGTQTG